MLIEKAKATGRPPETDSQILLDAAEVLFADRGFKGTTMRNIALKAKCNVALLAYYFENKEGLYRSVLVRHFSRMRQPTVVLPKAPKKPPFADKEMTEFYEALLSFSRICLNNPRMQKILLRELMSGGKKAIAVLEKIEPGFVTELKQRIRRLMKEEVLSDELDPSIAVISLIGPVVYSSVCGPIVKAVYGLKSIDEKYIRTLAIHLTRTFFQGWKR